MVFLAELFYFFRLLVTLLFSFLFLPIPYLGVSNMYELFVSSVSSTGLGREKNKTLLLFSNVHKSSVIVIVYIINFSIKPPEQQGRSCKWKEDAVKRGGNI